MKSVIYNYRASISVLSQLHAQHLRATEAAAPGVAAAITSRRRETAVLGNEVRMRLASMNAQNKKTQLPSDEFDVRKTHLLGIQRSFGGVLTEYNLVEKEARDNCRARAERQYRVGKSFVTSIGNGRSSSHASQSSQTRRKESSTLR